MVFYFLWLLIDQLHVEVRYKTLCLTPGVSKLQYFLDLGCMINPSELVTKKHEQWKYLAPKRERMRFKKDEK